MFSWEKRKKERKKNQNGRLKKTTFFKIADSQYYFVKISWISPWVSRIDWCKGHWCSLTYMAVRLFDISSKTFKKCNFCVFGPFLSLCRTVNHIGWATSMPFPSFNSINPRTNSINFHKKILRIGDFEKCCFFESAILNFFLLFPHENKSKFIG